MTGMERLDPTEVIHLVHEDYVARLLALTVDQVRSITDLEVFTGNQREGRYYNLDDVLTEQIAAYMRR